VTLRSDLLRAIDTHYGRLREEAGHAEAGVTEDTTVRKPRREIRLPLPGKSPVAIVDEILAAAVRHGATDVHIQPEETELLVRFRLDGILRTVAHLSGDVMSGTVSRVKILAGMDIAEHRVPQDGRHSFTVDDVQLDLRTSALPSQHGEKIVIRLLHRDMTLLDLDKLHMPPGIRDPFADVIRSPLGFYLVTGPTGSGKTTTLYATLASLDREELNIITLEDPVEYSLPGTTQVQIREESGLTFASGLRSVLRQDPDVVLVGEIRDLETLEIACRAALTGHKVLSTIHTNDACQSITRLLDMGAPPYLITATLRGVLAQRLVRVICEGCRETYAPTDTEIALLGYPKITELTRGAGCARCGGTGYKGRQAIFEYLAIEDTYHRLILDRASSTAIRHAAQRNGMLLMSDFAKKAVLDGRTTVAEIQRVIFSSENKDQLCPNCERVVAIDFAVCPFCQKPVETYWNICRNCKKIIAKK
jgi:type II secretory ATPase GspE/PulE/Tfp pilus assembly ATPase PilB-like protein